MDIKIWMMAGTSKSPENIPIHSVLETNFLGNKPPSSDHNFAFRSLPDELSYPEIKGTFLINIHHI
jgi:hypothetical protein